MTKVYAVLLFRAPFNEGMLDIVVTALTKVGGQEKYGTAPKSILERDIQAKLAL